jgi:hypothetical protein
MERRDAYKERIPSRGCSPLLGAILYTLGPSIVFRKRRFNSDRPGCAFPADSGAADTVKLQ